jgi:hypothetical protein
MTVEKTVENETEMINWQSNNGKELLRRSEMLKPLDMICD